jgi:CCR4-NOT complex subunit CAF16
MATSAEQPSLVSIAGVERGNHADNSVVVNSLNYTFPNGKTVIHDFSVVLPPGSRCLLTGANGAGKTTLLQLLAGKFMVNQDSIRILGRPAFHDIALTSQGTLSYLGPQWRRDIAFAGSDVPMQGDISAGKMIFGVEDVDPERRHRLITLLDIDLNWRLNKVSDGQRRRVQIAMGLLKPYQVLLLDEITVDMDVVGRLDLLDFFKQECAERGATIIYATHIFDGMEGWPTHMVYLEGGKLIRGGEMQTVVPDVNMSGNKDKNSKKKLLYVVEEWLRDEKKKRMEQVAHDKLHPKEEQAEKRRAPFMPSKHLAFFR